MHLIMRVNKSFDLSKVHDAKKIKRPKYLSLFSGSIWESLILGSYDLELSRSVVASTEKINLNLTLGAS